MFNNLFRKKLGDRVDVVMKSTGMQRVMVVDVIRKITGLGLNEATNLVAQTPSVVKSGIPLAEAEDIKVRLEAVGAKVVFK